MSTFKQTKIVKTLTTVLMLGAATSALAESSISLPSSNAKDSYVVNGMNTIDLGETINIDSEGYPTPKSMDSVFDEYDYQGALSSYLQTISRMNIFGSVKTNHYYGATGNTDTLLMYKDPSIDGMLTPNRTVGYAFTYPNLAETGPLVIEHPAGASAGIILDVHMRWLADMGLTSPQAGKATKFYFYTEGQSVPKDISDEYVVIKSPTNILFYGWRVLDPVKTPNLSRELKVYPYAERQNPAPNKFFQAKKTDDTYFMTQPTGMDYWKQLHELIQIEPVLEQDRFMMARLQAVGIEKGKPFNPTERQVRILEKAALVGEKMSHAISFYGRGEHDKARYRQDSKWRHPLTLEPTHKLGYVNQIEEQVDWAYEAYGISNAMKASMPGKGSTYLGGYQDASGNWLDGGKTYKLHIEPDAPAARFWDISVYSLEHRALLPFEESKVSSINSHATKNIKTNADGSVDIYFGPGEAPKGYENNFINTNSGQRWFTYFRLYGPTETYLDRSWKMNDIVEIK